MGLADKNIWESLHYMNKTWKQRHTQSLSDFKNQQLLKVKEGKEINDVLLTQFGWRYLA